MQIRFNHQVLIGSHVYAAGEVVEADESLAVQAVARGHAVEVRETVSPEVAQARKAVRKGR